MIPYNPASDTGAAWLNVKGTMVTHEQFVTNLIKERGDRSMNLEHMVIGICGEAGEIADAVKKNSIYGKELSRENIVEELGDIEFYIAGLRQMLGISAKEVFEYNVLKLGDRYKDGYSDAAAIARADKLPADTQLLDEHGAEMQSSQLEVVDVTKQSLETIENEAVDVSSVFTQNEAAEIPDWLRTEIGDKKITAAYLHRGTWTVLTDDGGTRRVRVPV